MFGCLISLSKDNANNITTCPHRRKHWPGERYDSESRGPAPNSQHSPWNITGDRHSYVICCPHHTKTSAAEMLQEATYVHKSWLRRTAPLAWSALSYVWRSFSVCCSFV